MTQDIINFLIACIPSAMGFLSMVVASIELLRKIKVLRNDMDAVKESAEMKEFKATLNTVINENMELKRQIRVLINKIDKIQTKEV